MMTTYTTWTWTGAFHLHLVAALLNLHVILLHESLLCKKLFRGTLEENVEHFVDLFEMQATLARLTSEDRLLLLPTCLADKASRWYQQEKK